MIGPSEYGGPFFRPTLAAAIQPRSAFVPSQIGQLHYLPPILSLPVQKKEMTLSHRLLKNIRLLHLYLGVFIAPSLLFFAFTGALQTFSLHETTRGSSYKPPAWVVTLAQIHKKQTPALPARKLPPPDKAPADKATPDEAAAAPQHPKSSPQATTSPTPKPHNPLPLKIFFLLVALGLFLSTLTGLTMSYRFIRNRMLITAILLAGIILPVLLTIL
jgi:hypothetical protein